jgi:hypothetical protein
MEALLLLAALPVLWILTLLTVIWVVPGLLVAMLATSADRETRA